LPPITGSPSGGLRSKLCHTQFDLCFRKAAIGHHHTMERYAPWRLSTGTGRGAPHAARSLAAKAPGDVPTCREKAMLKELTEP